MSYRTKTKEGRTVKFWNSVEEDLLDGDLQPKVDDGLNTQSRTIVGAINELLHKCENEKEDLSNKVYTISKNSTNDQYPGAKCVYDTLCQKILFSATEIDGELTLTDCSVTFNTLQIWVNNEYKFKCELRINNTISSVRYYGKFIRTINRAGNEYFYFDFCQKNTNSVHKHISIEYDYNGYRIVDITEYQPKLTAGSNIILDYITQKISSINPTSFIINGTALSSAFRKIEILHIRNNGSDDISDDCYISRVDDHNLVVLGGITTYKMEIKTTDNDGNHYSQWCFNVTRPNTDNSILNITYTGPITSPTFNFDWE